MNRRRFILKSLGATLALPGLPSLLASAVGGSWGPTFWYLTLFCGFLVLTTSMAGTADGVLRRWVDVFWTASPTLRQWDPRRIGTFYFSMLCIYAAWRLAADLPCPTEIATAKFWVPPLANSASEPLEVMTVLCFSTLAQPLRAAMSSLGRG